MNRSYAWRCWSLLLPLLAAAAGCAESNPFDTIPISGKVTYEDGRPINAATVIVHFIPQAASIENKYPQPAQATLGPDGTFAYASTFARDDGAIAGRHKVVLEATNADYSPRPSAVAAQFTDPARTPLSVDVVAGGENHFELSVRRGT